MESNFESTLTDIGNRRSQVGVNGRLATAEDHGVKQTLSAIKEIEHRLPCHRRRLAAGLYFGVVTVPAAPRTALHKYHRRQLAGEISRGKASEPSDFKHRPIFPRQNTAVRKIRPSYLH